MWDFEMSVLCHARVKYSGAIPGHGPAIGLRIVTYTFGKLFLLTTWMFKS